MEPGTSFTTHLNARRMDVLPGGPFGWCPTNYYLAPNMLWMAGRPRNVASDNSLVLNIINNINISISEGPDSALLKPLCEVNKLIVNMVNV